MKKVANSLMPLAAAVLFGTCLVSAIGLLVVLMTSIGFADGLPLFYYQRLNLAVISIALPTVGMILFAAILFGFSDKPADAVRSTVGVSVTKPSTDEEKKKEEGRLKEVA